ncbi:MAG: DUF169 domain-containing protein [Candidatus Omnitrophota bacterium]
MSDINWKFSKKFGTHWIKVKFYSQEPDIKKDEPKRNIRFCEATKEAITEPIFLDQKSLNCKGALYAFGWNTDYKDDFLDRCQEKRRIQADVLESLFFKVPRLKRSFKYIGLNTEGSSDILISYMQPEKVMRLLKIYYNYYGKELFFSSSNMMAICGGIAVKTYLENKINISFGCDDSRKYANMGRDKIAVGIPKKLFKVFVN